VSAADGGHASDERLSVAFSLVTLIPGRAGGAETYVRGLLDEFVREEQAIRLTVLGNRRVARAYERQGVEIRFPLWHSGSSQLVRFMVLNGRRLRRPAGSGGYDVIHYPVTIPQPRFRGTPSIVTLYDVQHHELPDMFSAVERWHRDWAYDKAAREATRVITLTRHSKAGIVRHLGIPPERIDVVYLGVDRAIFHADGPRAPGLPDRYIVYPANLWPHKNHDRLLAAFQLVNDQSLHLVLTGQPYGRGRTIAGHPRVRHIGYVERSLLAAVYRGALAMVYPSLFEGFGLPVLEAMSCGTPVVCTNLGAVAEVAASAARTFDPYDVQAIADAITAVVEDDAERARLRDAGLTQLQEFTWEACAAAHRRIYATAAAM
jgi:glycosyltransferase involved in cell wall biosynthesis